MDASLLFGPALLLLERHGQRGGASFPNHEPSQFGANFIAFSYEQHILLGIILFHVSTSFRSDKPFWYNGYVASNGIMYA